MKVEIKHSCAEFDSYRAARVKSLFNAESGSNWEHVADIPLEDENWRIGVVVGPSGSGKSSIGNAVWGGNQIADLYAGWNSEKPLIDDIAPDDEFNKVTAALSAVGLGDVPAWLRPFKLLSNGEQFRAGLARLICEAPEKAIVDEFSSVVDRQIAKVGASAFAKSWRKTGKGQIILLSCHYDILEHVQPDWVYDTREARLSRDCLRRPSVELEIYRISGRAWKYFKPHYYLDLPHPVAAQYFVGVINGEAVAHLAVCPLFTANAYRATRLVVMPEWQGAGVGTRFLNAICEMHLQGGGRCERKLGTFFHTSHPQLCGALRASPLWKQTNGTLYGSNKARSAKSMAKTVTKERGAKTGYGGHFRAVQAFKYIGGSNEV
ncbi:GNAT family N-acetyltransferase [Pedobacter arcticus]|uniref:GNAT family N-acetyltransferase n=1 Tax=Pedobacter arcticus TaxID=752140 RepID=UPI0002F6C650|nr:GNAT family N-acetyltransferase [Pedobacter arcticus]